MSSLCCKINLVGIVLRSTVFLTCVYVVGFVHGGQRKICLSGITPHLREFVHNYFSTTDNLPSVRRTCFESK